MAREKPEAAAEAEAAPELSYREQIEFLNPIAQPLASRKLTRKLLKCIRKATKHKQIRRGVKEVQKFINKGEKGITVLAGDTLPVEVYCHLPILCEERSLPYAYVPSKTGLQLCPREGTRPPMAPSAPQDLGMAAGSKRPACVIMIKPHEEYQEAYDECLEEVSALPLPL
ncbi:H/ACA ribonucleoprotein complex subunit 2 isoform X1 [Prinia subflava]|uniref:H/ACA ribonucleoprotein complex subunit 2 isoform X1 n=1 Tax=Prinia subflava TaxID=208062 RepID=UPI002FE186F0